MAAARDAHRRGFAPAGALRPLAYRLLWICAHQFHRAGQACMYAAAGLLRRDDLQAASRLIWRDYGTLLEDVDGGLEIWERRLYDSVLRPDDSILLVGCGAGRDLIALCEGGYQVTGLDPTPELVALARAHLARRGLDATVLEGFVESARLDTRFDVVVLAGNCYSFLPTAAARVATLARLKDHVAPGGRIVITYTGAVGRAPRAIRVTRLVARLSSSDWTPEPGDAFSRTRLTPRLVRYEHMFEPGEVGRECAAAGLRVVREVRTAGYYAVAEPAAAPV